MIFGKSDKAIKINSIQLLNKGKVIQITDSYFSFLMKMVCIFEIFNEKCTKKLLYDPHATVDYLFFKKYF